MKVKSSDSRIVFSRGVYRNRDGIALCEPEISDLHYRPIQPIKAHRYADLNDSNTQCCNTIIEGILRANHIKVPSVSRRAIIRNKKTAFSERKSRVTYSISSIVNNDGLAELLHDLNDLLTNQDYNDNYLKPTDYAIKTVKDLLTQSNLLIQNCLPLGTIYPDGDGGLRIEWTGKDIEVRLIVSSKDSGIQYIYHELREVYDVDYTLTANKLSEWLTWFNEHERSTRRA